MVFFRGNLGSFLLLLAYPLWTTIAGRIGETYLSYPLIILVRFQLHPLHCSACDHWLDAPESDFRPLIVVSVPAGLVVDLLL